MNTPEYKITNITQSSTCFAHNTNYFCWRYNNTGIFAKGLCSKWSQ